MTEGLSSSIEVPLAWERLEVAGLEGVLIVIGAPDTGKTTLARYIYQRLQSANIPAGFLDGDPGQSSYGPPATMTLYTTRGDRAGGGGKETSWRKFVGATTPVGHMLPVLVGAARLFQQARSAGIRTVVYDTSGFIDPDHGGSALKLAKIDLLQPAAIHAIQKDGELEPILQPLRRSHGSRLVVLEPSIAARRRDVTARQSHRAAQFARHFSGARPVALDWRRYAVLPGPRFVINQLIAFESQDGFVRALGIVRDIGQERHQIEVLTPLKSLEGVVTLHLGDLWVDPHSYRDGRISPS